MLKVIMTFGNLAGTQVRSPKHLKLDTVLLTQGTARQLLLYTVYRKEKQPSQLGYDLISDSNPSALHYQLKIFVGSRLSESMACVHSHGHPQNQQRSERVSNITRQKAVTCFDSVTSYTTLKPSHNHCEE